MFRFMPSTNSHHPVRQGVRQCLSVCLLSAGFWIAVTSECSAKDTWVLIGINDYSASPSSLNNLNYCTADVRGLQQVLQKGQDNPDVQVIVLADDAVDPRYTPSFENIERVLQDLSRQQTDSDSLIVAFSGHGVTVSNEGHLCLPNFQVHSARSESATVVPQTSVQISFLMNMMQQIPAARRVLIVDACRNFLWTQAASDAASETAFPSRKNAVEKLNLNQLAAATSVSSGSQSGFVLINSCMTGEMSFEDPELGHSVFFEKLIRGLEGYADAEGDRRLDVTIFELFEYCRDKVREAAEQTGRGTQQPILIGGLTGDFPLRNISESELNRISATLQNTRFNNFEPAHIQLARREYSEAVRALRMGAVDDVVAHCDEALKLNPDYPDALQLRAHGHLLNGNIRQAATDMLQAESHPSLKVTTDGENIRIYDADGNYTIASATGLTVKLHPQQSKTATDLLHVAAIKRPEDSDFQLTDTWIRVAAFEPVSGEVQQQQIQEFQQRQGIPVTQQIPLAQRQPAIAAQTGSRSANPSRNFNGRGVTNALEVAGRAAALSSSIRNQDVGGIISNSVGLGAAARGTSVPAPAARALQQIPNYGGWRRFAPGF